MVCDIILITEEMVMKKLDKLRDDKTAGADDLVTIFLNCNKQYLHNLITVQPSRSTRSSFLATLARPSTSSLYE